MKAFVIHALLRDMQHTEEENKSFLSCNPSRATIQKENLLTHKGNQQSTVNAGVCLFKRHYNKMTFYCTFYYRFIATTKHAVCLIIAIHLHWSVIISQRSWKSSVEQQRPNTTFRTKQILNKRNIGNIKTYLELVNVRRLNVHDSMPNDQFSEEGYKIFTTYRL